MSVYTPQKFIKRPVAVEAVLYDGTESCRQALREWSAGKVMATHGPSISITTSFGDVLARPFEWVIRGVDGEFYPCPAAVFERTYGRAAQQVIRWDGPVVGSP